MASAQDVSVVNRPLLDTPETTGIKDSAPAVLLPIFHDPFYLISQNLWLYMSMHQVECLDTTYHFPVFRYHPIAPDFLKLDPRYSILRKDAAKPVVPEADACITRLWGLCANGRDVYGDKVTSAYTIERSDTPEHGSIATILQYAVFPRDGRVIDYTDLSWMLETEVPPLVILNCPSSAVVQKTGSVDQSTFWMASIQHYNINSDHILRFDGGSYDKYIRWLTSKYRALRNLPSNYRAVGIDRGKSLDENFYVVFETQSADFRGDDRHWASLLHILPFLQDDLSRWVLYLLMQWTIRHDLFGRIYPPTIRRFDDIEGIFLLSYLAMKYPFGVLQIAADCSVTLTTLGKHIVIPRGSNRRGGGSAFWDALFSYSRVVRAQKTAEAVRDIQKHNPDKIDYQCEDDALLAASL